MLHLQQERQGQDPRRDGSWPRNRQEIDQADVVPD
jgi:hypothetical protein